MMLNKQEGRPHIPRDGRHCDLCGCSQPAVRCDKCGCQIFCLSCDDMYHRHPKRRFHLRKAVDTTPATPQARPVLPAKAGHATPGDPSKMPLPPPRKKKPGKSFFDTFRRRSPSDDNSPPLPKKEYSWTDRFGNIKKFMSNRPLPPLPNSNGVEEMMEPPENLQSNKHDLSFIHKKVEEKPPQLPQRSLKPAEFTRGPHDKENHPSPPVGNGVRDMRNGTLNPSQMSRNNGFGEESQWNNQRNQHQNPNTLMRQPQSGFMYPGSQGYPGTLSNTMHQSASATDLQNLEGLPPQYPHYPMPPHYPYPQMYPHPQFPNYPPPHQYFGNSFANLSSQPTTTDGDFSDHSEASSRHHPSSGKRYPFRKRAKRSQSVLVDRMAFPGQFYPFGPYPPGYGPGPWGSPYPMEGQAPPSPASSIRSLNRIGRTRRRKKTTSEDEEEDFSVSSSPLSRPKSSSSERPKMPTVETSSDEEEFEEAEKERSRSRSRSRNERVPRKDSDPNRITSPIVRSPQVSQKKFSKHKKAESIKHSDAEEIRHSPAKIDRPPSKESNAGPSTQDASAPPWVPPSKWECNHCTFINPAGQRICQVCCKTATAEGTTPVEMRPPSSGSRKQSLSSEKSCSSPEKRMEEEEEDVDTKRNKRDMAVLNSALDEAEKEISRGLEELMKLKEDFPPNKPESPQKNPPAKNQNTDSLPPTSKPVYKSSGKMRTSILDKLTLPSPTAKQPTTASASTETQTGATSTTDRVIEARRGSTSSTTSDAYNSPLAQSPVDNKPLGAVNKGPKKDTSCQTQTDELTDYLDRRKAEEDAYFGRPSNGFGYRYGDRVTSPVFDRGYPLMQRSHSRASLFTGRINDLGPLDYGLGPSPMYRSVSRSSLTGDYPENSFADFQNLRKPAYYLSMEELVERRRQDSIRAQGLELVRMIREAEQQGFTADDIQVALHNCGNQNPMEWLQENWKQMVDQVVHLSASYANDKRENDVGDISEVEARDALRLHKGNIWPAVTECVESRQRKFLELKARGKFSSKDITDALSANQGDVEMAYARLTKSSSKPFLMRIWGAGEGVQNQDVPPAPKPSNNSMKDLEELYFKSKQADDIQSDETWDEEEWDEDYEEEDDEEEQGDLEDLQTCHDDVVKTPDSDRSDYCDAFGSNTLDRNMRLPSNETIDEIPETKLVRRGSFLSKLAGLKKNDKDLKQAVSGDLGVESPRGSKEDTSPESYGSADQSKSYNPISVIKNTISAIRDTVSGGSKGEKKLPCAAPERRTIIVKGQIGHGMNCEAEGVKLTSVKPLPEDESTYSTDNTTISQSLEANSKDFKDKGNLNKTPESEALLFKSPKDDITGSKSKQSGARVDECKTKLEAESPSLNSEESKMNSLKEECNSKLQETSSKSEATASRELNGPNPVQNISRAVDYSPQSIENNNLTIKSNIDSRQSNLKSPEHSEELIAKENNTKSSPESMTNTKEDSLPLAKFHKDSKEQQKHENRGLDNNAFQDDKQQFGNKRTLKYITPISSSFSKKIAEKTNEVNSKNKIEKSISNAENLASLAINSKSTALEKSIDIQKQAKLENASFENSAQTKEEKSTIVINKISNDTSILKSSKPDSNNTKNDYLQNNSETPSSKKVTPTHDKTTDLNKTPINLNHDHDDSHLTQNSTNSASNTLEEESPTSKCPEIIPVLSSDSSVVNNVVTLETVENIQQTLETSSSKNQKIEMFSTNGTTSSKNDMSEIHLTGTAQNYLSSLEGEQDILNSSNITKQNTLTSDCHTKETVDANDHMVPENCVSSGVITSEEADIPLIDDVDNNTELASDLKINVDNDMPKYKPMEPILSSTFKRSSSLTKNAEDKVKTQSFQEGASTEEIQSHSYLCNDTSKKVESNKSLWSKTDSNVVEQPIQMVEEIITEINAGSESIETKNLPASETKTPVTDKGKTSSLTKDNTSPVVNDRTPPSAKENISTTPEIVIVPILFEREQSMKAEEGTLHSSEVVEASPLASTSSETQPSTSERTSLISAVSANDSSTEETATSPMVGTVIKEDQKTQSKSATTLQQSDKHLTHSRSEANKEPHSEANFNEANSNVPRSSTPNLNFTLQTPHRQDTSSKDSLSSEITSKDSSSTKITSKDSSSSETISKDSSLSVTTTKDPSSSKNIVEDSTSSENVTKDSTYSNSASTDSETLVTTSKASASSETTSTHYNMSSEPTTPTTDQQTLVHSPVADQEVSIEEDASEEEDSVTPPSPVNALRHRFEGLIEDSSVDGPIRPASPFRRMSFRSRKEVIALERIRDTSTEKPWFLPKPKAIETKKPLPKRSLKQQMETDRKVRKMVSDRKVRTYRKAEIVVQLMDMNFEEEEAIQAANECSTFEMALSYLQQECLLCTGHFPVSHIISMVHCQHKACRDCIRAYFTVQIRDRNIMELLCPFCNEPDISDEDIAQDYFNHLDMMLKKLVDPEIHELFQRKLRDRVLMRDPSFRWCSKCSSGFLAMENLKRLVCPDCNAVTCASCRRPWEREHQGITCEAFAALKDGTDTEAQAVSLAKLLTEDGIDCPRCHFRYALAKGGCMHFRCIQCQHDFCSGCSRPFKMGQKCGVSEFCAKLGLHAHHPRNCLFYLRDKDPEDLQRLLDLSEVKYDSDPPEKVEAKGTCQVMEQKETSDGMVDDYCGKEVEKGYAGLCRLHYVEYLGQLVNKHAVDPIQIFENDDLELVLRRANIRLPPKRYRESDESYRQKLVNLIHEELPLDKMDGS